MFKCDGYFVECVVKSSWNKLWNYCCVCNSWVSKCVYLFRLSFSVFNFLTKIFPVFIVLKKLQAFNFSLAWFCNFKIVYFEYRTFILCVATWNGILVQSEWGWIYAGTRLAYTENKRNQDKRTVLSPFYKFFPESPLNLRVDARLPASLLLLASLRLLASLLLPTCQYIPESP